MVLVGKNTMTQQKTQPHSGDVATFVAQVEPERRRAECAELIAMMGAVSGAPPVLWGSMIGFGQYHYRYASGHEGDSFLIGFAPRKAEFSIYLMGTYFPEETAQREALLARLGKHRMGKACLYVRKLADIDVDVLRELAAISVERLRAAYPVGG
ncbi:MAG TPA: DUF1801 domain-containing protein [Devosia sp.]|nr:DUF1801 domain-containing protein [Devosia sp.]